MVFSFFRFWWHFPRRSHTFPVHRRHRVIICRFIIRIIWIGIESTLPRESSRRNHTNTTKIRWHINGRRFARNDLHWRYSARKLESTPSQHTPGQDLHTTVYSAENQWPIKSDHHLPRHSRQYSNHWNSWVSKWRCYSYLEKTHVIDE